MINTPDINKEKYIYSQNSLKVRYIAVKYSSKLFYRFHIKSTTNSTQDNIWSPFLMVCVVTATIIPIFDISPTLSIKLHSQHSC